MIDERKTDGLEGPNRYVGLEVELQKYLKQTISKDEMKSQEEEESEVVPAPKGENKGLRLFYTSCYWNKFYYLFEVIYLIFQAGGCFQRANKHCS